MISHTAPVSQGHQNGRWHWGDWPCIIGTFYLRTMWNFSKIPHTKIFRVESLHPLLHERISCWAFPNIFWSSQKFDHNFHSKIPFQTQPPPRPHERVSYMEFSFSKFLTWIFSYELLSEHELVPQVWLDYTDKNHNSCLRIRKLTHHSCVVPGWIDINIISAAGGRFHRFGWLRWKNIIMMLFLPIANRHRLTRI